MEDKVCPFCGAEAVSTIKWATHAETYDYACGTKGLPENNYQRSETCKDCQIAALQSQVAGTENVLRKTHSTLRLINLWIAKHSTDKIWQQYQEEINPTPVEEEIIALLSPTPAGEWVSVRREDALRCFRLCIAALSNYIHPKDGYYDELVKSVDHLRAVLGTGGEWVCPVCNNKLCEGTHTKAALGTAGEE